MEASGMMEEVNEVGPNHPFHYKYLFSEISYNGRANSDYRLLLPTNLSILCSSFEETHKLLNSIQLSELSPTYFHFVFITYPNGTMPQKVLKISLVAIFAFGAVGLLIFSKRQGDSINLDKAQQTHNPIESDWKIWNSSDFGPDCDSDPYCYDPLAYNMGIEFRYPPSFTPLGYRDKGGGLWFSYTKPDNSIHGIAIDCTTTTENELVEWLLPRAFEYYKYTLLDAKNVTIEEYEGTEAIFEVIPTNPQAGLRKFKDRLIRFSIKNQTKVCEIQAPLELDRNLLEQMISSFRVSSQGGMIE